MTEYQRHKEKLDIALSELEEALDWFNRDEAFAEFDKFRIKLSEVLKMTRGDK